MILVLRRGYKLGKFLTHLCYRVIFRESSRRADPTAVGTVVQMGPVRYEDGRSYGHVRSRQSAPVRTKFHPF